MPATTRKAGAAALALATATLTGVTLVATPAASAAETQTAERTTTQRTAGTATKVRRALRIANNQKGDPYRYGAAGPNAFDCSGLVHFATHRAGFKGVPRTSSAQAGYMRRIKRAALRPGDFVFFTDGGRVYHVGVYVGRHRIVHAPYSGARVRTERIWNDRWFAGSLRGR
jgi:cell wall-associated NlpC family hydrolase